MMNKTKLNIATYVAVLLFGCWVVWLCSSLQVANSRMLPLVAAFAMMGLAVIGIGHELFIRGKASMPRKPKTERKASGRGMFFGVMPLFALAFGCVFFGFYLASCVVVAAYIRVNGGSRKEAVLCGLGTPLVIYLLFHLMLNIDLEPGLLWNLMQ